VVSTRRRKLRPSGRDYVGVMSRAACIRRKKAAIGLPWKMLDRRTSFWQQSVTCWQASARPRVRTGAIGCAIRISRCSPARAFPSAIEAAIKVRASCRRSRVPVGARELRDRSFDVLKNQLELMRVEPKARMRRARLAESRSTRPYGRTRTCRMAICIARRDFVEGPGRAGETVRARYGLRYSGHDAVSTTTSCCRCP